MKGCLGCFKIQMHGWKSRCARRHTRPQLTFEICCVCRRQYGEHGDFMEGDCYGECASHKSTTTSNRLMRGWVIQLCEAKLQNDLCLFITPLSPCSAPQALLESCRCASQSVSIKVISGHRLKPPSWILVLSYKERKERKAYRDGGALQDPQAHLLFWAFTNREDYHTEENA